MSDDDISLTYVNGPAARFGGLDITLSLTKQEADALGSDAAMLADWFDTALWTLAMLRTGQTPRRPADQPQEPTKGDFYTSINDLGHRLIPRLEGILDAAIRAHAGLDATYGDLALALDTARSTAQYRRDTLLGKPRSLFDQWAVTGGPNGRNYA